MMLKWCWNDAEMTPNEVVMVFQKSRSTIWKRGRRTLLKPNTPLRRQKSFGMWEMVLGPKRHGKQSEFWVGVTTGGDREEEEEEEKEEEEGNVPRFPTRRKREKMKGKKCSHRQEKRARIFFKDLFFLYLPPMQLLLTFSRLTRDWHFSFPWKIKYEAACFFLSFFSSPNKSENFVSWSCCSLDTTYSTSRSSWIQGKKVLLDNPCGSSQWRQRHLIVFPTRM